MRPSHYHTRTRFELTERQRDVLERIARGQTNRQIADALGITLDGAKFHVSEILAKLEVSTREEAADWWLEQNSVRGRFARFPLIAWLTGLPRAAAIAAGGVAVACLAVAAIAVTVIVAGGDSDTTATPTLPPATSSPTATVVAIGDPALEGTLAALQSGDTDTVMPLVRYPELPCSADPPGVVCPVGTAAGTPIPAFNIVTCEGGFAPDAAGALPYVTRGLANGPALYGIATGESLDQRWEAAALAAGGWIVVLQQAPSGPATVWVLDSGAHVVAVDLGCGDTSASRLVSGLLPNIQWVVAPGNAQATPLPTPAPSAAAARETLRRSDAAMANVGFIRVEQTDTGANSQHPGEIEVWQYEDGQVRIAAGGGDACTWFPSGSGAGRSPAFSERSQGGVDSTSPMSGTLPDAFEQRTDAYDGHDVYVVSYHFKAPSIDGLYDVWETDWIDRNSYRLVRYEQISSYSNGGAEDHVDAIVTFPPEGLLRDCPTMPTVSIAALQPLAAAVP